MSELIIKTYPEYGTRPLYVYQDDTILREFIKGKIVLIMDGKYTGKIGVFRRFAGTVAWIILDDTDDMQSLSTQRLVRICIVDNEIV